MIRSLKLLSISEKIIDATNNEKWKEELSM